MNWIEHWIEPERLWLVWQPPEGGTSRTRRVVAELRRADTGISLHYLHDTPDYRAALEHGFKGYPAFDPQVAVHDEGVLRAFVMRLPPRRRDDFADFLATHRLPSSFDGSDFALLAYAGGKLPADGFSVVHDLSGLEVPFEWVLEVAGFRHTAECHVETLHEGDAVTLRLDPSNPHDVNAVEVWHNNTRIGYINRIQRQAVWDWYQTGRAELEIERLNGRPERPLVYLFMRVTDQ